MNMTLNTIIVGGLLVIFSIVGVVVIFPAAVDPLEPSDIFRPRTALEERGRRLYIADGCTNCHSQYVRRQDWEPGEGRIAQAGDYIRDKPHLLGSMRTGPDLSQQGGEHTHGWHYAHFVNPRYTRPDSIMPPFRYRSDEELRALIAYLQSLGMKDADARVARMNVWRPLLIEAYERGPDENIEFLHSSEPVSDTIPAPMPRVWKEMPNPYSPTPASLERGEAVYKRFCLGCHGPVGDGYGPAHPYIYPPPLNFTVLRRWVKRQPPDKQYLGGIFYYQIMNGITGSAMPYFKRELESEKIWDVSNYVAVYFVGHDDSNTPPRGIDAAYEPGGPPERGDRWNEDEAE